MDDILYTTQEAAAYLRVSPTCLVHWRRRRRGPPFLVFDANDLPATRAARRTRNHSIRYRLSDLERHQEGQTLAREIKYVHLTPLQWKLAREAVLPRNYQEREPMATRTRRFIEFVLTCALNNLDFRDIPREHATLVNITTSANRWTHNGNWTRLFQALQQDPTFKFRLAWSLRIEHDSPTDAAEGITVKSGFLPPRPMKVRWQVAHRNYPLGARWFLDNIQWAAAADISRWFLDPDEIQGDSGESGPA